MAQRRWRPPPMKSDEKEPESQVKVDEQVVRKMLKVNPDMRKGRTTFQVKKALESGEGVAASQSQAASPAAPPAVAQPAQAAGTASSELQETIDFFVRGKAEKLEGMLVEYAERRKALEEEERGAREELMRQVISFVSLLDDKAVATGGKKALAKHAEFLKKLGLTPADVLARAGKGSSG